MSQKLSEVESNIFTGCAVLIDGTGLVSDLIKLDTNGRFSHAGVFFRLDEELVTILGEGVVGELYVGEMWYGKSFDTHKASAFLSISDGKCFMGFPPACVYENQALVLKEVKNLIRTHPAYGLEEFPIILASHLFGVKEDPSKINPVCSIALELCWKPCGVVFKQSLADPADFDTISAGTVEIEEG